MPSKKSCFNRALFQKHLSRFWPLWGGVSLAGAMFPLYLLLTLLKWPLMALGSEGFTEGLYKAATALVPGFTFVYAALCVMAVWGYLHNARAVGLMHTLPVDRTCLFLTNTLAALAMALIPYVITGGLICLIALGWGFFDLIAVVNTVLAVVFLTVLFTSLATLCAMLTGQGFALPAFYLLGNFLAFAMEILITSLASEFLLGVPLSDGPVRLRFLSPLMELYARFSVQYTSQPDGALEVRSCYLQGFGVVALYALAGCAILALSWFLYRRRHSESAGDVVAFRWLRPIFRYGVALLGGLTLGRLLYELLWKEVFQRGGYAEALPMAVCLFLGGLIGYYIASMLLEKTRRVFGKKSLPGVGIVAAGAAALCLLVSVDVFGLERKIPAWDEIESVSIYEWTTDTNGTYGAETDPDQAAALLALHQAILDDRSYIRSYDVYDWTGETMGSINTFTISYQLKDGSAFQRRYRLWVTAERVETAGTCDNLLAAFYQDPVVRARSVAIPEGTALDSIDFWCSYMDGRYVNTADRSDGDDRDTRQIYAALQKDAAQGNVPAKDVLGHTNGTLYLYILYRIPNDSGGLSYGRTYVEIFPSMTNTVDTLLELDYLTPEAVELWEQDLAAQEAAEEEWSHTQEVIYAESAMAEMG